MVIQQIQTYDSRDEFIKFNIECSIIRNINSLSVKDIIAKEVDLINEIDVFKNFQTIKNIDQKLPILTEPIDHLAPNHIYPLFANKDH